MDDDDDGGDFPGAPRDMGGKHIADQHMVVTCYIWRFLVQFIWKAGGTLLLIALAVFVRTVLRTCYHKVCLIATIDKPE